MLCLDKRLLALEVNLITLQGNFTISRRSAHTNWSCCSSFCSCYVESGAIGNSTGFHFDIQLSHHLSFIWFQWRALNSKLKWLKFRIMEQLNLNRFSPSVPNWQVRTNVESGDSFWTTRLLASQPNFWSWQWPFRWHGIRNEMILHRNWDDAAFESYTHGQHERTWWNKALQLIHSFSFASHMGFLWELRANHHHRHCRSHLVGGGDKAWVFQSFRLRRKEKATFPKIF